MSQPTVVATQDLLFSGATPPARPAPVFTGEQRLKALAMLGSAVSEQRAVTVMQLVNKDPSLVFEQLQVPVRSAPSLSEPVEFPLACLRSGLAAGYVFAVNRGFAVDTLLQGGSNTLLQDALAHAGARSCDADVSLLLGMGADFRAMPSPDALYAVVSAAFPMRDPASSVKKNSVATLGAVSMLLDAKVDFAYPESYQCPYQLLVQTGGWTEPERAAALTKLMARFAKGGLSLERRTGAPAMSPLMKALGVKNGEAVIALIRVGAQSGPEQLNGKDLFALMAAQGLEEFKPGAQSALMESHISQHTRAHAGSATQAGAAPSQSDASAGASRRRRIGAV